MSFVLDTDTLIYFLKGNTKVISKLTSKEPDEIHTTIINHSELFFGAFNSTQKKRNIEIIEGLLNNLTILDFCDRASLIFAEQKAALKKTGNMLADMDLMIASICLANKMTLVTNNEKHFSRLKQLKIENWSKL